MEFETRSFKQESRISALDYILLLVHLDFCRWILSHAMAAADKPSAIVDKSELLKRRAAHIGQNVALNYSKAPLCIMEGRGQYLYDEVCCPSRAAT